MADLINTWFTYILQWVNLMPQHGWAILLSVVIQSLATQWVKLTFSEALLHSWVKTELMYNTILRIFSLVLGFIVCYSLWPINIYRIWTSLATALIAPIIYKITMMLMWKKWPDLVIKLSGDPKRPSSFEDKE